jgi:RNA-directed DNA polymerase
MWNFGLGWLETEFWEVGPGTGAIAVAKSPSRHKALLTRWAVRNSYRPGRLAVRGGHFRMAREALRRIGLVMNRLGLTLHPTKTRVVNLRRGKKGFVFLGCTIRKRRIQRNPRWHFMLRWPSPKATKKLRDRVRELTDSRQNGKDVTQIIAERNPGLRAWGNYFRGECSPEFNRLDTFVYRRMHHWQIRRVGQRPTKRKAWTCEQSTGWGLHRLEGTVRYPTQATPRRSSLSCVQENRTHSCVSGECWRVQ